MKKNVLLLGSSGMLGSMILDVFSKEANFEIYATVRNKKLLKKLQNTYPNVHFFLFDAEHDSLKLLLCKTKNTLWIVNAIGVIKPFVHDNNEQEVARAVRINAVFPFAISEAVKGKKVHVIQIATDCVFSGEKGKYTEEDSHDPIDVYGKAKSLGEVRSSQFSHIRVSIIGPERGTQNSLLAWFLSQKKKATLNGFTNHKWNGITTLQFAKICVGMIKNNNKPLLQHIVPSDDVTKAELLEIFSEAFRRSDLVVHPTIAIEHIDRRLRTIHATINKELWRDAGYTTIPTVKRSIEELSKYMDQNI